MIKYQSLSTEDLLVERRESAQLERKPQSAGKRVRGVILTCERKHVSY